MKSPSLVTSAAAACALLCGCNSTTVTFQSGAFVGLRADVDTDAAEVVLTRGAAMAFDCTEMTELWSGPCRDFDLDVEDDDIAELIPSLRLDGMGAGYDSSSDDDQRLSAGVDPTSGVLIARSAGETTATVSSQSSDAVFTVVVIDAAEQ